MKQAIYDAEPDMYDYHVPQLTRLEAIRICVPGGSKGVKNPLYFFKMPRYVPIRKLKCNMWK